MGTVRIFAERGRIGQKLARVLAARRSQNLRSRALLLNASALEHDDVVRPVRRDSQVVGHQQNGRAVFAAQLVDQIEDALLHRHIEGAGGFVGDDQRRAQGNRNGDQDALAHAAGQLVRVLLSAQIRLGEADAGQKLDDTRIDFRPAALPVNLKHFGDLSTDGLDRVERCRRILWDQADLAAANGVELLLRPARDIGAVEPDRTGFQSAVLCQKPDHGLRRGGLSGARLAHERHDLTRTHQQRNLVDDPLKSIAAAIAYRKIADLENGRVRDVRRRGPDIDRHRHALSFPKDWLMRFADRTTRITTMPGTVVSHQARAM